MLQNKKTYFYWGKYALAFKIFVLFDKTFTKYINKIFTAVDCKFHLLHSAYDFSEFTATTATLFCCPFPEQVFANYCGNVASH